MVHYLDNKQFEVYIKEYQQGNKNNEDELVSMLDSLIDNILVSFNFQIDFDDAKQDCFVLILKILKNFNPKSGSAFNYFTTTIVNNLKLIYTKNKKYNLKIAEYIIMNKTQLLFDIDSSSRIE